MTDAWEYEDARAIYRHTWRDAPTADLLEIRYRRSIRARAGEFAASYNADIVLAINDILRNRP
jgi:hypothetical protein